MLKAKDGNRHQDIEEHIAHITTEFRKGLEFVKKYPKSVTIFGSSRLTVASSHYHDAEKLAERIVRELGYSITTGGGPGIMEAANKGAREAGGKSIGINIKLPTRQHVNGYVSDSIDFDYFFSRKMILAYSAEAFVFFPGGYGTMDELFEILTLIQTEKTEKVPVILFGKDFWIPFKDFLIKEIMDKHHSIEQKDLDFFTITDSIEETINIIQKAPTL